MARNIAAIARALPNANTVMSNPTGAFGGAIAPATQGGPASPLIASYAEWSAGRASSALPRDFSTFLAGTFGPLMPMQPQPINQPAPGEERPGPRRTQYPVSWNMPHGVPGDEGLKLASYASLRSVADTYSVARACIQLRKSELLGVDWDIVPTKDAEKKMRGDQKARRDFDERRAKVLKFFQRPDSNYLAFRDWFAVLLEDVFVIDALTLYMWPSTRRGGGVMGSNLGELTAIDGTTIRPMYDIFGNLPRPPNPSYQQYLFGVPRSDFASIINGNDIDEETAEGLKLTREYCGDRLIYRPMVPRNWTPYGYGPVERALVPIMSGMQRQNWQLSYFAEGTVPGMIISTGDANSTPNQCRELQDALNAMAGDPAWKHKIIVIPGGSKIDPLRPTELSGPFDEMIMTQVTMSFEVMPMELGLSTHASRNAMGAASNIAKASQEIQDRKSNVPVLEWFSDIFNFVIKGVFRQPDMQWHWNGLEEGEDEAATVDVLFNEVSHGGLSIDEARVIRGHQPWGIPLTSEPVYFTATGVIPLGSIDMATGAPVGAPPTNAMQAAAGVVPGAPPVFGAPSGGPGKKPGEPNGKPKPKGPDPNGSGGGGVPTPAHAGAQAAAAAGHGAQALPAHPKPLPKPVLAHQDPDSPLDRVSATKMAETVDRSRRRLALPPYMPPEQIDDLFAPEVDGVPVPVSDRGQHATVFDPTAALRELDLIGNRLAKGRPLNGWTNRHIPADVFKVLVADLEKAGPKGYIHGWIKVGAGGVGDRVHHPELGHGSVTRSGKKTSAVRFDSGAEHAFEHAATGKGHFVERVDRRRAASVAVRAPKAPAKAAPAAAKPVSIHDLLNADDATIESALRDVYEGKFGPYTTKATIHVTRAGVRVGKRGREHPVEQSIAISGNIFDARGEKIGDFSRSIGPADMTYADGTVRREVWAQHEVVQLGGGMYDTNPTKYHGKGFGGEFNKRAIDWYRASGVHGISQDDQNGYVWASQGFNFGGGIMPEHKQEELRELIAALRAGKSKNKYHEAIPSALRNAPDLDRQLAEAEALLSRLATSKPGEPGYPTAYEVSQLGRRGRRGKIAIWLGKHLKVSANELILNPSEGEVVS